MEHIKFFHEAATRSATIQYAVEIYPYTPTECVAYMDKIKFDNLCQKGCPNYSYKWSCPPFAPSFERFALKWENLYIVFMYTDMFQFSYIKNDYLKIKAANSMLKSRADQFIRDMARKHGGYISTGSCRLCKPCKCKLGMSCAHPELMAYSFEALGINVGQLVEECFKKQLMWYKSHCLPQYTSVVCGILTNENLSGEYLQISYKKCILH